MFWGNDDDERRKREEEEARRKREDQERKNREASDAKRKAKDEKKYQLKKQKRREREQKEMDELINAQMGEFGSDNKLPGEEKAKPKETNMLGRGMLDSIFGASNSAYIQNRSTNQPLYQPGKPVIGHQKGESKPQQEHKKESDPFGGKSVPKLWRPI